MATRTPLAPSHGAGGVFCVEAIDRARGGRRPTAGQARAAAAHGAKRRHQPPTPRGHSGGRARLAHRRSSRCSQKSGGRPTKTRSFCVITPRFLRRGGSAAEKTEKQRETTDAIAERAKTLTSRHRIISKNTFSHRALPGKCRPKFARFIGLRGNRGAEYSFYFKASRTKNKKRIDNAQEAAPQIVHFHASPHSLCPIVQRLPASTLKINALSFRFVGHNGQKTLASGAQFPVFRASLTTKSGYFTSEGR